MEVSFKSRKLKSSIKRISDKAKNLKLDYAELTVFGVSKKDGIAVTGKGIGKDLGNYFYFEGQKFAYNPYRINIGSIGLSSPDFKGLISPAYVIFEVDETIYPEFLLLYLKSNAGIRAIKWYGDRGGVRSSLRFSDLEKIDFPNITYKEQITFYNGYLKKLESIEKAQIVFDRQLTLISKLRQSTLQDALLGKLTKDWRKQNTNAKTASDLLKKIKAEKEKLIKNKIVKKGKKQESIENFGIGSEIHNEWEYVDLDDISQYITDGTHQTPTYVQKGRIFLSAQNVKPFRFMPEKHKFVSEEDYQGFINNKKTEKGDLLLGRVGAGIGETAVVDQNLDFAIYVSLGLVKTFKDLTNPNYLAIVFNSPYGVSYAKGNVSSKGSSAGNFNLGRIRSFKIPFPSLEEQNAIVEKVNQLFANYSNLEHEITKSKANTENLLQSVLNELLGEDNSVLTNKIDSKKEELTMLREIKYNSKTLLMDLVKLLKENGELHAEDLWKMSKYPDDIDAFYAELKKQIEEEKTIKELENKKGYLELT